MRIAPHTLAPALLVVLGVGFTLAARAADEPTPAWAVAGQQGLVRYVIVPAEHLRDRAAYLAQVRRICEPGRTCFLNFYANPAGAALTVPLPDAIERETAAIYRWSEKNRSERFEWSCRLQVANEPCF